RREGDDVDLLRDVVADGLDLVLLLLLRVGELQVDAGRLRRALDGVGVGAAPTALGTDLREAEGDCLGAAGTAAGGRGLLATRGKRSAGDGNGGRAGDETPPAYHEVSFGGADERGSVRGSGTCKPWASRWYAWLQGGCWRNRSPRVSASIRG